MEEIGAHYVSMASTTFDDLKTTVGPMDIVLEATGAPHVPFALVPMLARNGVMALVGIPTGTGDVLVDSATMIREMVMANQALLGSVNASPPHFHATVKDLSLFRELFGSAIDKIITETYPLESFREPILHPAPESIKSVLDFTSRGRLYPGSFNCLSSSSTPLMMADKMRPSDNRKTLMVAELIL